MQQSNKIKRKCELFIRVNHETKIIKEKAYDKMEHLNLLLFEDKTALETAYPDGKVDDVNPGVAYAKPDEGEEKGTVLYNRMVTNYEITILSENKSGETVAQSYTVESPIVLDGNEVRMNVVAEEVEGYKPRYATEKVSFSGNASHTIIYLAATSYTVTVNHMYSGESIASATTIEVDGVYEEDVARVKVEPLIIPGYTAEPVFITVSGDMTYNLEYEESSGPVYEFVDLGLPSGTLWATCNIGASSPEEYGDYFAWGEIVPNKASAYTPENYRFYAGDKAEPSKYNSTDGLTELELEDDAAHVIMGGDWHMPTADQLNELLDNTTSAWTTFNGVSGWTLTSNNNGESIFIPATGEYWNEGLAGTGEFTDIWSQTIGSEGISSGYSLGFYIDENCQVWTVVRFAGFPIRGVIGDGPEPGPQEPIVA